MHNSNNNRKHWKRSRMKLLKFRVFTFRSVMDSGWIECDRVTTLIGVNEAGKSNLLLALWKLNPAKGGEIDLLKDIPRHLYTKLRNLEKKPVFISADFELSRETVNELTEILGWFNHSFSNVRVSKDYSGHYLVDFPGFVENPSIPASELQEMFVTAKAQITAAKETGKTELGLKGEAMSSMDHGLDFLNSNEQLGVGELDNLVEILTLKAKRLKSSQIYPIVDKVRATIECKIACLHEPLPSKREDVIELIMSKLPTFVYYSNYGNLDSEIYLPHVIENLGRTDLSSAAEAKARTLRVLFDYVGLNAQEIYKLGKDPEPPRNHQGKPTRQLSELEIEEAAKKKKERDILLQSASARLTSEFRDWWKQGNYRFDFHADGPHFRIWVSDDLRPEKVELESRSTGLQWFLSFYLIFLVESDAAHHRAILLLDEAGLSLHPLAQRDLSHFFDNLSKTNQIIHTTHSPFLIDTNHVDRVRVVYVDDDGYTVASSNLRDGVKVPQNKSFFSVHAALGLSVSDAMLLGCSPIIVEGPSDQFYLSAIKNYLISQKRIAPKKELVFIPSGGVRGIETVASILSGSAESLPFLLVDSDQMGRDYKNKLLQRLYAQCPNKICSIGDVLSISDAEVEDLIPLDALLPYLNRLFRDIENEFFEDVYDPNWAIIPQIETFANKHGILMEIGWKVDLARSAKQRLLQHGGKLISKEMSDCWTLLFEKWL